MLARDEAKVLRQLALDFESQAPEAVARIVATIDRNTVAEKGWSFVQMGPIQNRAVVRWIYEHSKRPRPCSLLWAEFFCNFRTDTNEIIMTRAEMGAAIGFPLSTVSECLGELLRIGALIRHQEGRKVRWFMNSQVATCLTGAARENAQKSDPPVLKLVEVVRPGA
jgi:hypothetical protein